MVGTDPPAFELVHVKLIAPSVSFVFDDDAVKLPPPVTLTVSVAASTDEAPKPIARAAAAPVKRILPMLLRIRGCSFLLGLARYLTDTEAGGSVSRAALAAWLLASTLRPCNIARKGIAG